VELAHQLCQPHGPYAKSEVARALDIARSTLSLQGKQAKKDKQVAVEIAAWHETDDTLGHRKLAALLKMGKNRVKRVMKKYGIAARRKRKKYLDPGKASSIVPNLLREIKDQEAQERQEVVFSDLFEVCLADRTQVRGCFALWKRDLCIFWPWLLMRACTPNWSSRRSTRFNSRCPGRSSIRIKAGNMERRRPEQLCWKKGSFVP
jgi:putative transposase